MLDVYLTVDTECSMGGAWGTSGYEPVGPEGTILGKIGDRFYGIPLIMDLLEEHRLRGTFFVEVFAGAVVGERALAEVYRSIVDRGHDAQLHLHPVFRYYAQVRRGERRRDQLPTNMDSLAHLPREGQRVLLEEGVGAFRRLLGHAPIAFRAGNYAASDVTLDVLEELGIRYDSSFNAAYIGRSCLISRRQAVNSPWRVGSLWEIPLTVFSTGIGRFSGLKPLEVSAVSVVEMKGVLEQAERLGMGSVNVILHSFSLYKRADIQFTRLRPDRLLIRRLRRFCEFLARYPQRFRVVTFGDRVEPRTDAPGIGMPDMGALVPSSRRVIQGLNRSYWV